MTGTLARAAWRSGIGVVALWLPLSAVAADRDTRPALGRDRPACACPVAPDRVKRSPVDAAGAGRPDAEKATLLADRLCAEATKLPKGASANDLEAAMVYAVSQTEADTVVVVAALDRLRDCDYGQGNFLTALGRVRDSYASKRAGRGTGSLAGSSDFRSAFTSPTYNIGGGTSNYTR